ncbi:hypothetical protein H9P43_002359 [Blastocladiella emersonii ATCC 22665]|nr:hypothetical protein H9P43_002359 [Blastocladiella emersonii ATCC 22665]
MGRSAKFVKRPSRKQREIAATAAATASSSSLSKTANKTITKASSTAPTSAGKKPTSAAAAAAPKKKLGKFEIDIARPDYIDLLSGRRTFDRKRREVALRKGNPQGLRVVTASAAAQAAVQAAVDKQQQSKKKQAGADGMELDW